jgi:(E)-4-hydroxy-3-methylbut-2-enyl-diphosphate synthase
MNSTPLFVESLTHYIRRKTNTVKIGDLYLGSDFPIRIQSMTTTDTMDTQGSVEQIIRMVDAGCKKEAYTYLLLPIFTLRQMRQKWPHVW